MAETLNLGTNGDWATKENSLLGYNSENGNYKPLPLISQEQAMVHL